MATAAQIPAVNAKAQRPHAANVYKPAGVKPIQSLSFDAGTEKTIDSKVDLKLPIRGFRLRFSGRVTTGVAPMASVNPEGILNLLPNIKIDGTNARQGGNVTLWDIDLATLFVMQHLHQHRAGHFDINGTSVAIPGTPFPAGYFSTANGTYDFRIAVDLPAHPFGIGTGVRPGYLIREEEWSDSLAIALTMGDQQGAGADGALGTAAATTTVGFSAFGSATGKPKIDLYSLPVQMGHLRGQVLPGLVTRTQRPINTILQSAGAPVTLQQLQKRRTSRLYLKTGTATLPPFFTTLDDTNVTAVGLQTGGGDRNIKPVVDVFAHKQDQAADFSREAIQGYLCLDFLQSGNPDSSFAAQSDKVVGSGSTFELIGNVVGETDGYGIVVQEQIGFLHGGGLYNF